MSASFQQNLDDLLTGSLRDWQPEARVLPVAPTNALLFVVGPDGSRAVLKRFRAPRACRREKRALETWAIEAGLRHPSVLATPADDTLLLTVIDGCLPQRSTPHFSRIMQAAGLLLRRLHDLPHADVDELDSRMALEMRLSNALERAAVWVTEPISELVRRTCRQTRGLPRRARVPGHGDYVPRNWLANPDGLGIIDFENSRMMVPEADFLKLHMEVWPVDPGLRRSFFAGYGGEAEGTGQWLQALEILELVGTVNWSLKEGMTTAVDAALARLEALVS